MSKDLRSKFSDAKVGLPVISSQFGVGEIIHTNLSGDQPLFIKFEEEFYSRYYRLDGRLAKSDTHPTLFFSVDDLLNYWREYELKIAKLLHRLKESVDSFIKGMKREPIDKEGIEKSINIYLDRLKKERPFITEDDKKTIMEYINTCSIDKDNNKILHFGKTEEPETEKGN